MCQFAQLGSLTVVGDGGAVDRRSSRRAKADVIESIGNVVKVTVHPTAGRDVSDRRQSRGVAGRGVPRVRRAYLYWQPCGPTAPFMSPPARRRSAQLSE